MVADILMYIFTVLAVVSLVALLILKVDIIISLLTIGFVLLIVAISIGRVPFNQPTDTFYPLQVLVDQFKITLAGPGFIILLIGGYAAYMSYIDANNVVVNVLTKPLVKIKKQAFLIPVVYIIGNILSLGVPSASTLAIILMATLFPVLRKTGVSVLSAVGVIATTATIMPTPLGADNVQIASAIGISVSQYVFTYHAIVSLPTLVVITVVHFFWQQFMDKRDLKKGIVINDLNQDLKQIDEVSGGKLFKTVYTILPLLPIILLIITFSISFALPTKYKFELGVELVTFISFIIAIVCEWIRKKKLNLALFGTKQFWTGMGKGMETVVLLVAANVFVAGLTSIGILTKLQQFMFSQHLPGITLPLILQVFTFLIVLLSGSGTSLIFAMAPLVMDLATAANIDPAAVSIPLQMSGNLLRSMSPVAAVIIICSKQVGVSPIQIVKRTAVPMLVGVVVSFALAMGLFLTHTI